MTADNDARGYQRRGDGLRRRVEERAYLLGDRDFSPRSRFRDASSSRCVKGIRPMASSISRWLWLRAMIAAATADSSLDELIGARRRRRRQKAMPRWRG